MFNNTALKKAMFVGVAGTIVMTTYSFVAHYARLPHGDFHSIIAGLLPQAGAVITWIIYFATGVFFAYIYKAFFLGKLPAHSWMRGVVYAFLIWFFMEVVLMPVMGMGFFPGSLTSAVGLLVGTGFYGATVGYLYDQKGHKISW